MSRLLLLLFSMSLLISCNKAPNGKTQAAIVVSTADWQLMLNDHRAPVETPLIFSLNFSPDISKVPVNIQAELVGVSMYMGKIPLQFSKTAKQSGNHYKAEFLLGACSIRKMQWQLSLNIRYDDASVDTETAVFYSSWVN